MKGMWSSITQSLTYIATPITGVWSSITQSLTYIATPIIGVWSSTTHTSLPRYVLRFHPSVKICAELDSKHPIPTFPENAPIPSSLCRVHFVL